MFEFLYSEGKFLGFYVCERRYETSFKRLPVLWSAAQSLRRAIKGGSPELSWKHQMVTVGAELDNLAKAYGLHDEFVGAIIDGIPKEAKERGVYTEEALKERFSQVAKVARVVDLVPAEGAHLPVHILSYLQSLLLFESAANHIPTAELRNERVDFSQLNTDDILHRAKYWIDKGDFTQALKYMNLLKGASRTLARQWMDETRILIETQQAANMLMTHAAFNGLMYL